MKKANKNSKNKLYISLFVWVIYMIWLLKITSSTLTLTNFLVHALFLVILIFIYKDDFKIYLNDFKTNKSKNIKKILLYSLILFGILILSNILISIISGLLGNAFDADSSSKAIYQLFNQVPFGTLFVMFLTIFFYPIVEEIVFRKSLRDVITNPVIFVIISSLITWYFQVTLASPHISEFVLSLSVLFNSIFASIIFVKKKNLLFAIIPRMVYNFVVCGVQLITLFMK